MAISIAPKKAGVAKKSQQKMDREKREAEAKEAARQAVEEAKEVPSNGGLFANAKISEEALKKLTEKKRERLFDLICESAVSYGIAFATVEEIEARNILGATFLAMNRAIAQLSPQPALALIDGNRDAGIEASSRCIVDGDAKCASIAAASILAKVTRDRYMLEMAERYPMYGFAQHKGYGTKAHDAALREYGPCEIHRASFLKKMH